MRTPNGFLAKALALVLGVAAQTGYAQGTLEAARKSGTVVVGIYNQAPWGFQASDGKISGQSVDVLVTAFQRMGIKDFTPVISEFSALIPGLQAKRFDVVAAGLFIRPDRCRLVAFGNPDIRMGDGLLVRTGNPHNIHSYEDIARNPAVKIGTARGNVQAQTATNLGVPAERQLLFPDNQSALAGLIAGRVDAVSATAASIVTLARDAKGSGVERALPFTGPRDAQGKEAFVELAGMVKDGTLLQINQRYGFSEADMPEPDKTAQAICNP
jgi:polar amino acid transport system substrate-binding protein